MRSQQLIRQMPKPTRKRAYEFLRMTSHSILVRKKIVEEYKQSLSKARLNKKNIINIIKMLIEIGNFVEDRNLFFYGSKKARTPDKFRLAPKSTVPSSTFYRNIIILDILGFTRPYKKIENSYIRKYRQAGKRFNGKWRFTILRTANLEKIDAFLDAEDKEAFLEREIQIAMNLIENIIRMLMSKGVIKVTFKLVLSIDRYRALFSASVYRLT